MHNLVRIAAVMLAQIPSWHAGDSRSIPDAWETFRSLPAAAQPGELEGTVMVCKVEVTGSWDTFSGPDLLVAFTVHGRTYRLMGPEDTYVATVSFPASLKSGDA